MRTAKTLIRLGGCPGWSEPSLGAHVILFVLWCCGSFFKYLHRTKLYSIIWTSALIVYRFGLHVRASFSQLVTQPTRATNNSISLIDHNYSSNADNLSKVHVSQIGISDHFAVFCSSKINACWKMNLHKSITYKPFMLWIVYFNHFDDTEFLHDLQLVPLKIQMIFWKHGTHFSLTLSISKRQLNSQN